jgi:hypothetical protein
MQFPIKYTERAVDHVFFPGHAFASRLGPGKEYLRNSLARLAGHERDIAWPVNAPARKLSSCCHGIDKGLNWKEMLFPFASKLFIQHCNVSASNVVRHHHIVIHILDNSIIHGIAGPRRKQKRHPKAMEDMAKHVPPLLKVALCEAPGGMLVALFIGAGVTLLTEAT